MISGDSLQQPRAQVCRVPCVPGQLRQWLHRIPGEGPVLIVVRVVSISPVESMVEYLSDGKLQSDFAVWMEMHTEPVL